MLEDSIRSWNPWWAETESLGVLSGTQRELLAEILKTAELYRIKDIIGVRRSGKTTLMYQVVGYLLSKGAKAQEIVFLNFDDPELNSTKFEDILKAVQKVEPLAKYLFIDEVQQKPEWERWVRTLYDKRLFKQIFVSGSSASLLSQDIGRVLTGRHLTFIVFPFSFREALEYGGWKNFDERFLNYNKNKLLHYQDEYVRNGGFPEVAGRLASEKKIILTNTYNDIIAKDISARFGADYEAIKRIGYHLLSNLAKEFSYRGVAKAAGVNIETAEKYIGFLKESFIILTLDFFSYKTKEQFRKNKKAYCIDNGLRNAVSFRFMENLGTLLENTVFIELKRREKEVYYWKNKYGNEVDFLEREGLRVTAAIQVCINLKDAVVKKRELKGLAAGMKEFKQAKGVVITEDTEGEETIEGKRVKFVPLWKWLLSSKF